MKRARMATAVALVLTAGCSALINVPDLELGGFADGGTDSSVVPPTDGALPPVTDGALPPVADAGDAAIPACANLTTDPLNCGACGHSCRGLSCADSLCQPSTLASNLGRLYMMTGDATYLYYSIYAPGTIARVKKDGTAQPEILISDNVSYAVGVAIDGNTLYYGANPGLYSCDVSNGATSCLTSRKMIAPNANPSNVGTEFGLEDVQIYQGNLYWGDDVGTVFRAQPDGGARVPLWTGIDGYPFKLAFGGGNVYLSTYDGSNLLSAQVDGGNPLPAGDLFPTLLPFIVADDAAYDYAYIDDSTTQGKVVQGLHTTRTTKVLAANTAVAGQPMGVAVDAQYVYWTDTGTVTNDSSNADGRVLRCLRTGCTNGVPTVVASNTLGGGAMWIDNDFIYFAETNNGNSDGMNKGRIRRVTKP